MTEAAVSLLVIVLALDIWIVRRVWLLSERVSNLEGRRNGSSRS